jgi:Arc/MetJ family transcription regulator
MSCQRSHIGMGAPSRSDVYHGLAVYTGMMSKHLVDIDEVALAAARAELGTDTIKDTVNESLRAAASARAPRVREALDLLAGFDLRDRVDAWR